MYFAQSVEKYIAQRSGENGDTTYLCVIFRRNTQAYQSYHELRHTRATLLVNSAANLYAIAAILGHADLSMLRKHYVHSDAESIRNLLGIERR